MSLAEATVRVVLDITKFDRDLQNRVERAANEAGRKFDQQMKKQFESTGKEAVDKFRVAASTGMTRAGRDSMDGFKVGFNRDLQQFGGKVSQQLKTHLMRQVRSAGTDWSRQFMSHASNEMSQRGNVVGIALGSALNRGVAQAGATLGKTMRVNIVSAVSNGAKRDGENVGSSIGSGILSGFGAVIPGMRPLLYTVLGGMLLVAGSAAGKFVAAAAPAVGVIGLLPSVAATAAIGLGTLVVALHGMKAAMGAAMAGDAEALSKAVKDMGPAARSFVKDFSGIAPELTKVRTAVQEAFFSKLNGQLKAVSATLLGPVKAGMTQVSGSLGRLTSDITRVLSQKTSATAMETVFGATSRFFDRLGPAMGMLTQGILDLLVALTPAMDRFSTAFGNVISRFGAFLSRMALGGQALDWVNNGMTTMAQLGNVVKNIGGVLSDVFKAARSAGGDYLSMLNQTLVATREYLQSAEGQRSMNDLFGALHDIVAALTPVLKSLLLGLGDIAPTVAHVIEALGPGLSAVIAALAGAIQAAGPGLAHFADALAQFGINAAPAIRSLGGSIGRVLDAAAGLVPIATILLNVLATLLEVVTSLPQPLLTAALALGILTKVGVFDKLRKHQEEIRKTAEAASQSTGGINNATTALNNQAAAATNANNQIAKSPGLLQRMAQAYQAAAAASRLSATPATPTPATPATPAPVRTPAPVLGPTWTPGPVAQGSAAVFSAMGTAAVGAENAIRAVSSAAKSVGTAVVNGLRPGVTAFARFASDADANIGALTGRLSGHFVAISENARQALGVGLARGIQGAANAVDTVSTGMQVGLNRVRVATDDIATAFRAGLLPGVMEVSNTFPRANLAMDAMGEAATRVGRSIDTNLVQPMAIGLARGLQTAETAASRFGSAVAGTITRPLNSARDAYQATTSELRSYTSMHSQFLGTAGQTPAVFSRVRDSVTNFGTVMAGTGAGLRAAFDAPIRGVNTAVDSLRTGLGNTVTAVRSGFATIGGAATSGLGELRAAASGAGAALRTGLSSAIGGLIGALGGPWGLAITVATTALSIYSSAQDEARQRVAEHRRNVAELADTLDKGTGAVTTATRAYLADKAAREGWTDAANKQGISTGLFLDALTRTGPALGAVEESLQKTIRGQIESSDQWKLNGDGAQKYGITLDLLSASAAGNKDAQKQLSEANVRAGGSFNALISVGSYLTEDQTKLAGALFNTGKELSDAEKAARDLANSMSPAARQSLLYRDALGVLRDNVSDLDRKTAALKLTFDLLNGGSGALAAAQLSFDDAIGRVRDTMKQTVDQADGYGAALLRADGTVSGVTRNGRELANGIASIRDGLINSTSAIVDFGQKNGDMQGSLVQVAQNTQIAREQVIAYATSMGIGQKEAENIANAMGLIPRDVVMRYSTPGGADTILQLAEVKARAEAVPGTRSITVDTLSDEAIRRLEAVGLKVRTIDGRKEIYMDAQDGDFNDAVRRATAPATKQITISYWESRGGSYHSGSGNSTGIATGAIVKPFAEGGFQTLTPMNSGIARVVPANTWRVVGDRLTGDEAYIPINNSLRSRAILTETARRMGFAMFANGGIAGSGNASPTSGGVTVASGAIVVQAPFADPQLVARATLNALAREAVA